MSTTMASLTASPVLDYLTPSPFTMLKTSREPSPSINSTPTQPLNSAQLLSSTRAFLHTLSTTTSPSLLLTHFSTTSPVSLLHCPATCPHPHTSLLLGLNAVRSYFDLLATHWMRSHLSVPTPQVNEAKREVTLEHASMRWTWRASGRSWVEEFTCVLGFDELGKICRFEVRTEGDPRTCAMRAVDLDDRDRAAYPPSMVVAETDEFSMLQIV